jgi:hypothetical protein
MSGFSHSQTGRIGALALVCCALVAAAGCKTIHEEIRPIRETTLTVARAGGQVTLSWIGQRGMYYSVMYAEDRGGLARWNFLPDAVNVRGLASGEPIVVQDRLPASQQRYYRLVQDSKPIVP